MTKRTFLTLALLPLGLAACDVPASGTSTGFRELPEEVRAIADPNQNLNAVKVDEVDGCYVYQHVGPVETTFLPLRTADGRPICTRAEGETAEG